MEYSIFNFSDYKPFLSQILGEKSQRKGLKSKLASEIGCNTTYISQILNGDTEISLELAEKTCQFLHLNEAEAHYFLLLVQKNRAGTHSLKNYFKKQIQSEQKQNTNLKKRVGKTSEVSKEEEAIYYSSWIFAAIHVALSVPDLNTKEKLAQHFHLPISVVSDVLHFLVRTGLATQSGLEFKIGQNHIHLKVDSPNIIKHHTNWRIKAVQSLESQDKENLHYSSAVSISQNDVYKIKELLIEHLKEINKTIQISKEEEIYAFNFDFFKV